MLAIRLPEELEARIAFLAKTTGRSKSFYVREVLEESIDDLEDKYLALSRLEKPSRKRWSLEELEQDSDLDD